MALFTPIVPRGQWQFGLPQKVTAPAKQAHQTIIGSNVQKPFK